MRNKEYIEREALLERIDGIWDCNDMTFRPNDHCCNVPEDCKGCKWAETRDAIRRIVENAPAADVRPVVKAYWIKCNRGAGYKCSVCKARSSYADVLNGNHKFCYKCGAMMGGNEPKE